MLRLWSVYIAVCQACFLCGIKTSLPLRKNVSVFQDAYLKLRQTKRRRTVGKRRVRNAVRTLDETEDGISGTFTHQANQTKKVRLLLSSGTQKSQICTCSCTQTINTHCSFSVYLLPALRLSQINRASKGCDSFSVSFVVYLTENHSKLMDLSVNNPQQTHKRTTPPLPTKQYKEGSPLWSEGGHET